jgi:inorganic triphosphatase YgiF
MRHRELELKLELSRADVARLVGELPFSDLSPGPASRDKICSVYFDTPQHDLHAAGISLRLRRQKGGWLQTVKAEQHIDGGLSNPIELEALVVTKKPDPGRIADKNLRRLVQKATKGSPLRPVFETVVQRMTRRLKADDSEIELAVDEGEVRTRAARRELREAELELKSGSTAGLLLAAATLFAGQELKFSSWSKAERGYRLAKGKSGKAAEPQMVRKLRIRRKDTCVEAFSAILSSVTQQILANRQLVLDTDKRDGTHQLRIGLHRLRSALRAVRPLVVSPSLREFERSARDIARCVGMLRDADVLITAIYTSIEAVAADKRGFAELYDTLVQHRQVKRDAVTSALRGAGCSRLQLYLALWPSMLAEAKTVDQPISLYARKILQRRWKKTAKYGRDLNRLSPERRHEMRKSLKEMRYLTDFFASLFQKRDTRRFIKQLKRLQDAFGYMNDVQIASQMRTISEQNGSSQAAIATSYILGRHEAEALHVWRTAGKAWNKLRASPRFWR